jgi:conjugative transfer region protein TrbK
MNLERMIQPQDVGFMAFGILIGALAVVAMQAGCEADVKVRSPSLWTGPLCPASTSDPIAEELARCRDLPPEKADDLFCQELWATQRRNFLAPSKAPKSDGPPLDPFPTVPKAQQPGADSRAPAPKSE